MRRRVQAVPANPPVLALNSHVPNDLQCITCDACGLGSWFEFIIGGLLTAWWVLVAVMVGPWTCMSASTG